MTEKVAVDEAVERPGDTDSKKTSCAVVEKVAVNKINNMENRYDYSYLSC